MDNNIQNNNRFSGMPDEIRHQQEPINEENSLNEPKLGQPIFGKIKIGLQEASAKLQLGKDAAIKLAERCSDGLTDLKARVVPYCKQAPEKVANFLLDCMAKVIVKSGYSAEAKDFLNKAEKRFDEPGYTRRREGEASSISPHGPPPPIPSREGRPPLGEYSASEAKINSDWQGIKPSKTTRPEQSYFAKSRADHTPEENIGVDDDDSDLDDYLSSSEYFSDDDDQKKNWL